MPIACEVCGSTDLIRNESGFFVCQGCGIQYTLEAVRNLAGITQPIQQVVTLDGRIESFFNEGDYEAAYELFSGIDDPGTLLPRTVFFGTLSCALVARQEGRVKDFRNAFFDVIKEYTTALITQKDVLKRDKVDELLACMTIVAQIGAGVYQEDAKVVIKKYSDTTEVDSEDYINDLKAVDWILGLIGVDIRDGIETIASFADEGYQLSENQKDVLLEAYNVIQPYDKYPYTKRQIERLTDSELSKPHRILLASDDVKTLRKKAEEYWQKGEYDISGRIYSRVLSVIRGDYEASFFSRLAEAARHVCTISGYLDMERAARFLTIDLLLGDFNGKGERPPQLAAEVQIALLEYCAAALEAFKKAHVQFATQLFEDSQGVDSQNGSDYSQAIQEAIGKLSDSFELQYAKALHQIVSSLVSTAGGFGFKLEDRSVLPRWEQMMLLVPVQERDEYWQRDYEKLKAL